MDSEQVIWEGRPSPFMNFNSMTINSIAIWFWIGLFEAIDSNYTIPEKYDWVFISLYLLPLFSLCVIIYNELVVRFWKIKITSERIIETTGILSRLHNEIELFRVKDIFVEEPFILRIFKLSNIIITSSDKTHPIYTIPAVKDGIELKEKIRDLVTARRLEKGVREADIE